MPRLAAGFGFALGFGLFGAGVSWVYIALHTFGGMPLPLAESAPPTPSSPTSIRCDVALMVAEMLTLVARACLATFARASDTMKYAVASTAGGRHRSGVDRTVPGTALCRIVQGP